MRAVEEHREPQALVVAAASLKAVYENLFALKFALWSLDWTRTRRRLRAIFGAT
jgi:hypothetical protein